MNTKKLPYIQQVIFSTYLNENRLINIYNPDESQKLPVIYLLDGGTKEQFPFITEIIIQLIENQQITPVIVVGIENTNRNFDLTNTTTVEKDKKWVPQFGNSSHFSNFISEELIPYINENQNTSKHNTIVGESLAALFILEVLFNKPTLFSSYMAIDPSLWWNNHTLFEKYKTNFDFEILNSKKLWIASSKTVNIKMFTKPFVEILKEKNISSKNWYYLHDENQTHKTIFKSTIKTALLWVFKP